MARKNPPSNPPIDPSTELISLAPFLHIPRQVTGDISDLQNQINAVTNNLNVTNGNVSSVSGNVGTLSGNVSGLSSSVNGLSSSVAALSASIPLGATSVPPGVAISSALGTSGRYAKGDHTHSSGNFVKVGTTDANGRVLFDYTLASYTTAPAVFALAAATSGQPYVVRLTGDPGTTSVTIQVMRSRPLPTIDPVSGLLTAVITGVNAIVTALTGFDIFGAAVGADVKVFMLAAKAS